MINPVLIVAGIILVGVVGFIIYDKIQNKKRFEKIIVAYSERVGDSIVEHDLQYAGLANFKDDTFKIPKLFITMPIPTPQVLIPTNSGKKKIYLIKLGAERYGFRIPLVDNEVYLQVRDKQGNPIKISGKPKLRKYKWQYCDDVVEPDVKHWDENIMEKLRMKHRTKADMLSKWIAPIIVGLILVAGIVTIQMTTKFVSEQLKEQRTLSIETAEKVEQSAGLINSLINKVEPKPKKEE